MFDTLPNIETVKRILSAGLKAPTNDHMRNWEFVIITEKDTIASILNIIPDKATHDEIESKMDTWQLNDKCQREMYRDAIPKQYEMLYKSGCLILPFFKQSSPLLKPETLSSLNAFASIWCCIENILLAASVEGLSCALRIPQDNELEHIINILNHPKYYLMPCYISLGYASPDAVINRQHEPEIEDRIHLNCW